MLLTLLQNRSAISTPPNGGGGGAGFSMGGAREVYRTPILQRALEARAPKVKPAKERAAKRAKDIEVRAAQIVVSGAQPSMLEQMTREWMAQRPYIPPKAQGIPLEDLFLAQVAFRIQQLDLLKDQDDEEAIIALLLS